MARGDEPRRHLTRGEAVSPRRQAPSWLHVVEGGDHSLEVGARALRGRGESQDDVDARALAATGKGFTLASRSLRRRAEEMRGRRPSGADIGAPGPGPDVAPPLRLDRAGGGWQRRVGPGVDRPDHRGDLIAGAGAGCSGRSRRRPRRPRPPRP